MSPCKIMYAKAFSSKYTAKSITGPTAIDNLVPVTSQAISSEAITSLEIDIPMFNHTDGPIRYYTVNMLCYYFDCVSYCSHYFIVIINATVRDTPSTALVEIDQLGPHSPSRPYYVAAVLYPDDDYNPDIPFILGNGRNTTRGSTRYENVPITVGTYRYFVRAYTIGPVSQLYKITLILLCIDILRCSCSRYVCMLHWILILVILEYKTHKDQKYNQSWGN